MLEQWEADALIAVDKVYSFGTTVSLATGTDEDYQIEAADGTAFFLLDIRRSRRNPLGVRYQLRYRRDIVLVRLCVNTPHTNPDGALIDRPHLHRYREDHADRWATPLDGGSPDELLKVFCRTINLPEPEVQGGVL